MSGALVLALSYIERGWAPIPIPLRTKEPDFQGWPNLRITAETAKQYFNGKPQNIGVLLGTASGGIVDVDLDDPLARKMADSFLPETGSIFGRETNQRSHRLYQTSDEPGGLRQYHDTDGGMIVEYRANGTQTIFPGSTHKDTGELITWATDGTPATIERAVLLKKVGSLAAATLIAKQWHKGNRDKLCTALIGCLLRTSASVDIVEHFITSICEAVGDDEPWKRTEKVQRIAKTLEEEKRGREVTVYGWPKLEEFTNRETVRRLREWLGIGESVHVQPGFLHQAVDRAAEILAESAEQLSIYQRGKLLVRPFEVERPSFPDGTGTPEMTKSLELVPITVTTARVALTRCSAWVQHRSTKGGGMSAATVDCPLEVAKALFEAPDLWRQPVINSVAQVPIFDGRHLISRPGWNHGVWIDAPAGIELLSPLTKHAAQTALNRVTGFLAEFPFANEQDLASALAMIMTAALRPSLGLAPGFMIDKHSFGAGATTLAKVAGTVATGRLPPVLNANAGEKETTKLVVATLLQARSVLVFDNLTEGEPFRSSLVAQMLSDRTVVVRELGLSKEHEVDAGALVIMTGVNISTADDLNRRVIHIQLDPKCEHPESRVFIRPNLLREIQRQRVTILSDLFSITAAYLGSGEDAPTEALAGFEQWTKWVAKPLAWLGLPDVTMSARSATYSDPTNEILRQLLPRIRTLKERPEHRRKLGVTVADMLMDLPEIDSPDKIKRDAAYLSLRGNIHQLLGEATGAKEFQGVPQLNTKVIGKWLARISGRVVDGQRLVRARESKVGQQWAVETVIAP